jgi:nickel transport protein
MLLALMCPAAWAHHLWMIPSGQELFVARGLAPDRMDAYDPKHVVMLKAFDRSGREIPIRRADQAHQARFSSEGAAAMAAVVCEWGGRVNTPDGKKLLSKHQALEQELEVVSAFESTQYAKSVFDHRIEWTRPLGLKLEIVALENPIKLTSDEALTVQVLFDGAPLAGCPVGAGKEKALEKTDEKGIAKIRLEKPGLQVLIAIHNVPVEGRSDIDYQQFMSFLSFNWP